jgi:CHAT domain-containing protein/tetratricopeptide (TPR) repeat protein
MLLGLDQEPSTQTCMPGSSLTARSVRRLAPLPLGPAVAVSLLLLDPGDAGSRPTEQPPLASPEQPLSGGATRTHALTVRAGDFIRVNVDHWELPLAVTLRDPSGHELARAEAYDLPIHLSAIADADGSYEVALTALGQGGKGGRYRLAIDPPRPASEEDRQWVLADQAQAEAARLVGEKTAESWAGALERYRDARERWRHLRQPQYEAEVLNDMGVLQLARGAPGATAEARRALEEALSLRLALQDARGAAETLIGLGKVESRTGNLREALGHLERAGPLLAPLGLTRLEAFRLNNIAVIYGNMGEPRRALEHYALSLPLRRQIGDLGALATVLVNIGATRQELGERDRALAAYEEALPLARAAKDPLSESQVLANMGALRLANGDPDGALEALQRSAELGRKTGDRSLEAAALRGMGRVHVVKKDYPRAVDLFSQTLEAQRAMNDRGGEGFVLLELGRVHRLLGREKEAEQALRAALDLMRAAGNRFSETLALLESGKLYLQFDRRVAARETLDQALASSRSTKDPTSEAAVLFDLAELERREGDLSVARQNAEAAIDIFESLRTRVAGSESRASFFVSAQEAYELELDLLAALGKSRGDGHLAMHALEMSERKRGRSLLDSLAEASSEIVAGLPAELRRQQIQVADRLRTLMLRQERPHTEEQASGLAREINELVGRYQELDGKLSAASPAYQAFLKGTTASASEVQQLLDEHTVLLEFALGERASYVFSVTRARVEQVSLPARAEITAAVRACHEALALPPGHRGRRSSAAAAAEALSRMVLAPVAARLDRPRLVIVADGPLQRVPWAALPEPAGPHRGRPLIAAHEIVLLPSASILKALRAMPPRATDARRSVVVLADPVFEADDPRLGRVAGGRPRPEAGNKGDLVRAARAAGFSDIFPRLPFSRQEAQSIVGTAPPGSARPVLDFEASRETALSAEIQDFRIVHFATHGLIDDEHPSRSGLVLSLIDRGGQPRDGFLRLPDLYNLRLNADLVVLSACRSAMGTELRGEGLQSVVRGFMYAGAPRVVAAVWDVDDRATAAFMGHFYRAMLVQGQPPAAALRHAQLAIRARTPWRDPFYWAGFVLEGEWR